MRRIKTSLVKGALREFVLQLGQVLAVNRHLRQHILVFTELQTCQRRATQTPRKHQNHGDTHEYRTNQKPLNRVHSIFQKLFRLRSLSSVKVVMGELPALA